MPELPEVETVRLALEQNLSQAVIDHVCVARRDLRTPISQEFEEKLLGRKMIRFDRRGKYLHVVFDSDDVMIVHLGMSGILKFIPANQDVYHERHDHIVFHFKDGRCLIFNDPRRFGQVFLSDIQKLANIPPFLNMGPEPLSENFTIGYFLNSLKARKGPIKTALMDQSLVAGLGNIYVCEALFYAGISPKRKAYTVQGKRAERLHRSIRDVLQKAIKSGGSSLKDYKTIDGAPGYFQHLFAVYDRLGRPCPDCHCDARDMDLQKNTLYKQGIKQIVQAGRSTFYCSIKQR